MSWKIDLSATSIYIKKSTFENIPYRYFDQKNIPFGMYYLTNELIRNSQASDPKIKMLKPIELERAFSEASNQNNVSIMNRSGNVQLMGTKTNLLSQEEEQQLRD